MLLSEKQSPNNCSAYVHCLSDSLFSFIKWMFSTFFLKKHKMILIASWYLITLFIWILVISFGVYVYIIVCLDRKDAFSLGTVKPYRLLHEKKKILGTYSCSGDKNTCMFFKKYVQWRWNWNVLLSNVFWVSVNFPRYNLLNYSHMT